MAESDPDGPAIDPIPALAPITAEAFKAAFRHHAAGVAVLTAEGSTGPVALTASSVTSISADPPILTVTIARSPSSAATLVTAETVVVHLLGADQLALAKACATPGVDRFADTDRWSRLSTGEPYFHGARVRLLGRIQARLPFGQSTLLVIEVVEVVIAPDADQRPALAHHDRAWHRLDRASALD